MGTLKTRSARLLASGGHLCTTCCDGCANPWQWSLSAYGGATWANPWPQRLRISYLDSVECGGASDDIQGGEALACAVVESDGQLRVHAEGFVETHDADFERLQVQIDGASVLWAASVTSGGDCEMEFLSIDELVPVVAGQIIRIRIVSTTVDGRYHQGAYWDVVFDFEPLPSVASARVGLEPPEVIISKTRYSICKACADTLQDGFGCRHHKGCCFGRHRSSPTSVCPLGKW